MSIVFLWNTSKNMNKTICRCVYLLLQYLNPSCGIGKVFYCPELSSDELPAQSTYVTKKQAAKTKKRLSGGSQKTKLV